MLVGDFHLRGALIAISSNIICTKQTNNIAADSDCQ